jgi:hypothetical protein
MQDGEEMNSDEIANIRKRLGKQIGEDPDKE